MIVITILLLIIVAIIITLYKRRNKNTPVRLEKQVTSVEKFQIFTNKYHSYLFLIAIILILVLLVMLIIIFVPGTESGIWYNGGVENAVS